ncbi:hypothetical protein ABBQ38_015445 [Trebouxia sp. C0009 RCD-2024]
MRLLPALDSETVQQRRSWAAVHAILSQCIWITVSNTSIAHVFRQLTVRLASSMLMTSHVNITGPDHCLSGVTTQRPIRVATRHLCQLQLYPNCCNINMVDSITVIHASSACRHGELSRESTACKRWKCTDQEDCVVHNSA